MYKAYNIRFYCVDAIFRASASILSILPPFYVRVNLITVNDLINALGAYLLILGVQARAFKRDRHNCKKLDESNMLSAEISR